MILAREYRWTAEQVDQMPDSVLRVYLMGPEKAEVEVEDDPTPEVLQARITALNATLGRYDGQ